MADFTEEEHKDMFKAFIEDELYGAGSIIADKTCEHLEFNGEQIARLRGKMIDSISKSNLNKLPKTIKENEFNIIMDVTLASTITNYAEVERQYQDALRNLPNTEEN
jgi:hypothetical protein